MSPQPRVVRRLRLRPCLRLLPERERPDGAAPRDGVEVRKNARAPRGRAAPCRGRGLFDQIREHAVAQDQQGPRRRVLPRGAGARERRRGGGGRGFHRRRRRRHFLVIDDSIEKTNSPRGRCCAVAFQTVSTVARVPARARPRHRGSGGAHYNARKDQIDTEKWKSSVLSGSIFLFFLC